MCHRLGLLAAVFLGAIAAPVHAAEITGKIASIRDGDTFTINGTDIHRLFDLGYVTVDTDRRFVVSNRLKADFDNGREYYALHGVAVRAPMSSAAYPERTGLEWHREHRLLG